MRSVSLSELTVQSKQLLSKLHSRLSIQRGFRLETRTNAPPKDIDEQTIPKSLEHIIKLKEAAKTGGVLKRKRKKKKNTLICVGSKPSKYLHPKAKPEKVVPVFQQKPGEHPRQFWHRVSRDTHNFLKETAFEKKYNIQVKRDPETGAIAGLTKCKPDKDDVEMVTHKNINRRKKMLQQNATKLTRKEKQKQKLSLKKEKQLQDCDNDFGMFQDTVAFGEVAHEPPRLKIKSKEDDKRRKVKGLLLNSLFEDAATISCTSKTIDRRGKRKKLPFGERRQLEKQQNEAIMAYRELKSQRLTDTKY